MNVRALIENFDSLSPNAKIYGLNKIKEAIDKEVETIKSTLTQCDCGHWIDINNTPGGSKTEIRRECVWQDPCEFGENEYGDVKYSITFVCCPVCGTEYITGEYCCGKVNK